MIDTITDPKLFFHSREILLLLWNSGIMRCLYLPVEATCINKDLMLPMGKPLVISEAMLEPNYDISVRVENKWYSIRDFKLIRIMEETTRAEFTLGRNEIRNSA